MLNNPWQRTGTVPYSPRAQAFTFVEILVALALMAALLAAVAVAMNASVTSYGENQEMSSITQTARFVIARMTKEIRQAEDVNITSTKVSIVPIADGSGLTLIEYEFQSGSLFYRRTVNGATTASTLIDSTDTVKLLAFTPAAVAGKDASGNNCNVEISVQLTFSTGGQTFSVSGSAAPRRNQLF